MSIVKTVEGDLLKMFKERKFSAIAHGCNCFHTMGAGIAGRIARQFPEAFKADRATLRGEESKLGTFSSCRTDYGIIYNLYTQFKPGREDGVRLSISIINAFGALDDTVGGDPSFLLGIPMIGTGKARGDWETIENLINFVTPNLNICLVEYQP